jgi:hypothetical protein
MYSFASVRRVIIVLAAAAVAFASPAVPAGAQATPCTFSGPAVEQAKCLLRPVKRFGELGAPLASLPAPLDTFVGRPVEFAARPSLTDYLRAHSIREADVGGPLSGAVSKTSGGELARYFIIHDTSSPALPRTAAFPPAGMDTASWPHNRLAGHVASGRAHVFVNRLGESATARDFKTPWRATKYELQSVSRRGLFLSIELIQPRRLDSHGIDSESPNPGFTDAQLDRLAVLYVAASVRRGQWLIPAYHAAIDAGFANAHDDPQNFDLDRWAERLDQLISELRLSH